MTQNFHDKIAKLCINHFQSLPKTGKPTINEWTVLSCIVKENLDNLEVVSLGTGSKCIGKSTLSPRGDILNDSHAEIICRRAFLRYIYDQINSNGEIFNYDRDTSKYCLKDSVTFHFFTSHVPCGDAAIFPKQDSSEVGDILLQSEVGDVLIPKNFDSCKSGSSNALKRPAECDSNVKSKQAKVDSDSADIFRTGAKCLPDETRQDLHLNGPEYHTIGAVRTKPGRGDRTLSVSCSDKIAKWGVLGVQGALLSLLIKEPIYLRSFTIAGQTQYCEKALMRTLFERFNLLELKSPYRLNKMSLGQASVEFEYAKDGCKQPCPSSIAWCKTNLCPLEVGVEGRKQGVTKKKRDTKAGRLQISKVELFRTFLNIVGRLKLDLFENKDLTKVCYGEAKAAAGEYQQMWEVLKCNGFKVWTVKDNALMQFVVD